MQHSLSGEMNVCFLLKHDEMGEESTFYHGGKEGNLISGGFRNPLR